MATKGDLQTLEEGLTSKIKNLAAKIGILDPRIGALETKVSTIDTKIDTLQGMIKSNRYWIMYGMSILALVFTLLTIFVK
jgi:hypothetical protein